MARSHYQKLAESGVQIFEYTPGFIHAKVFLSDDRHAVVGTINLDYRSLRHHFECAAYLYGLPVLKDIKEDFRLTQAKSRQIKLEDIAEFSPFSKLFAYLTKFLAPLL